MRFPPHERDASARVARRPRSGRRAMLEWPSAARATRLDDESARSPISSARRAAAPSPAPPGRVAPATRLSSARLSRAKSGLPGLLRRLLALARRARAPSRDRRARTRHRPAGRGATAARSRRRARRPAHEVDELVACAFVLVRPDPVLGERERAAGRGPAGRCAAVLERQRSLGRRGRGSSPSSVSAPSFEMSTSPASASSPSSGASSSGDAPRARALRRTARTSRSCTRRPLRGRRRASRGRPRPPRRPGGTARAPRRAPRTCGCVRARHSALARLQPGRQRRDQVPELRLGSPRVAGLEVEVRGFDRPPQRVVGRSRRRQLARAVEEERRRPRRAPRARVLRGVLERRRDRLVRLVDRRRELPGARLGILEQLGEPGVDLRTAHADRPSRRRRPRAAGA